MKGRCNTHPNRAGSLKQEITKMRLSMEIHRKIKTLRIRCYQHFYHPRRPRGGQLGQEKRRRRRKFSRAGERAPGMLLLTDQFHNSFELSISGRHLSDYLRDLLIPRSLPASSTVSSFSIVAVTVWLVQESFLRKEFSEKMGRQKPKNNFRLNSYIYCACNNFILFHTNSWYD